MKKVGLYLLVLGLMLGLPLNAFATTSAYISNTPDSEVTNSDETVTKYYSVYVNTTNNEEVGTAKFGFQYGQAVTQFVCEGAGDFELDAQETTGANAATCNFAVPNSGVSSGEKILVGKLSVTVKADANDEDCTIEYVYEGATGKVNPETGAMVPYIIIGSGLALAAGVYFVTKKRSKLYNI